MIIEMPNIRPFIMYLQISRYISLSSAYSNFNRESKFMKKIMSGNRKLKTKWYDNISADLRSITEPNTINKPLSMHTVRRMIIRDKLFMEHITDQISMGKISDLINGKIEITHVKITSDFKYVNIFWIYSNNACIPISDEVLHQCAKILRHQLSELRIIGRVPPIQFVKNKQYFMTKEIDKKLAIIDENLKSCYPYYEENIDTSCINTIDKISCNETKQTIHDFKMEEFCIQLPVMKHDILGLDHYKIMSQITSSLSKSEKASQRRLLDMKIDTNDNSCHLKSKEVSNFLTQEEQQKIFSDFLTKRRIEEKRRRNTKQSYEQKLLNNFEENKEEDEDEDKEYEIEEYEDDNNDIYKNKFEE